MHCLHNVPNQAIWAIVRCFPQALCVHLGHCLTPDTELAPKPGRVHAQVCVKVCACARVHEQVWVGSRRRSARVRACVRVPVRVLACLPSRHARLRGRLSLCVCVCACGASEFASAPRAAKRSDPFRTSSGSS